MCDSVYLCDSCAERLYEASGYDFEELTGGGIHLPACEVCRRPTSEVGEGAFFRLAGVLACVKELLDRTRPIPVTERLPEKSSEMRWGTCPVVQAFVPEQNGAYGCWFKTVYDPQSGNWWEDSSLEESLPKPSHWLPLHPKPESA